MTSPLSVKRIDKDTLKTDKHACRIFGGCGLGKEALYLNTTFLDRSRYIPLSTIRRIYKRIAMSKGGFSGKGAFGSIPYLVVEYDEARSVQCTFKYEEDVDALLLAFHEQCPGIPTLSKAGEQRILLEKKEAEKRKKKHLSPQEKEAIAQLNQAMDLLEERMDLCNALSHANKVMRITNGTQGAYRTVAYVILILGGLAAAWGLYAMLNDLYDYAVYFLLIGLAIIFLFSGVSVRPTARTNRARATKELQDAEANMADYLKQHPGFPIPAHYAHPICILRMIRSIEEGRASTIQEAYEDLKNELKRLNKDVQVTQSEYEEVVTIKPMFLVHDYQ